MTEESPDIYDYFIEEFHGHLIRIRAKQRPDPYGWCIPISDAGIYEGVSTNPLNRKVLRTADHAAKSLGFENPYGLHKERIIMSKHGIPTVHSNTDAKQQAKVLRQVADLTESGKITLTPVGEHALADGGTLISFIRHEH